jgi:hypothetical protein
LHPEIRGEGRDAAKTPDAQLTGEAAMRNDFSSIARKFKCSRILFCLLIPAVSSCLLAFFCGTGRCGEATASELKVKDYYPLAVGNQWEFEIRYFNSKDGRETILPHTVTITGRSEGGKGMVQYFRDDGSEFLTETGEGIQMAKGGIFLLKAPIVKGASWGPGKQHLTKVEETGVTVKVKDSEYHNCLKIAVTADLQSADPDDRKSEILAIESVSYYAPEVGPVIQETYHTLVSGETTLTRRMELVRFTAGKAAGESGAEKQTGAGLVTIKDSFRFPKKGFQDAVLSPDDRWLIYQENESLYEKLYCTEVGKEDATLVPFHPPGKKASARLEGPGDWSPDGKTLAIPVRSDSGKWIALVDFRTNPPSFMGSYAAGDIHGSHIQWSSEGEIFYFGEGSIVRLWPGGQPQMLLPMGGGTPHFQVAQDGTVLFLDGHFKNTSLFLANYKKPLAATRTFSDLLIADFDLSPTGEYALLKDCTTDQLNQVVMLANLKTLEILNSRPIYSQPVLHAKWSPDGSKLAYLEVTVPHQTQTDPPENVWMTPHFFILDLKTGQSRDYGFGVSEDFSWTPDGKHILYTMKHLHESLGMHQNGIFIMRVEDGKELGRLTAVSAHLHLAMSPSCRYIVWQALGLDTFFIAQNPLRKEMLGQ